MADCHHQSHWHGPHTRPAIPIATTWATRSALRVLARACLQRDQCKRRQLRLQEELQLRSGVAHIPLQIPRYMVALRLLWSLQQRVDGSTGLSAVNGQRHGQTEHHAGQGAMHVLVAAAEASVHRSGQQGFLATTLSVTIVLSPCPLPDLALSGEQCRRHRHLRQRHAALLAQKVETVAAVAWVAAARLPLLAQPRQRQGGPRCQGTLPRLHVPAWWRLWRKKATNRRPSPTLRCLRPLDVPKERWLRADLPV